MAASRVFDCARLLTPRDVGPALVVVSEGRVDRVEPGASRAEAERLDGTVVPGYVDLQVNGLGQHAVLDGTPESIAAIATALPAHGVTAWLATVVTAHQAVRDAALDAAVAAQQGTGARVLGVHLEGPWISVSRRGAHAREHVAPPVAAEISRALDRHPGLVRLVTLAPEEPGALQAVERVIAAGAVAAIGHTDATDEQAAAAVDAGVRFATHLFNAMPPVHHRAPGAAGLALTDDRVVAGLVADGEHVHPRLVRLVFAAKPGRVALTSDLVPGPVGRGAVRLSDTTLAGSLTPLGSVVPGVAGLGVPLETAVAAASAIPARVIEAHHGRIEPGAAADLVVLDEALRPRETYVGGNLVWARAAERAGPVAEA